MGQESQDKEHAITVMKSAILPTTALNQERREMKTLMIDQKESQERKLATTATSLDILPTTALNQERREMKTLQEEVEVEEVVEVEEEMPKRLHNESQSSHEQFSP